VDECKPLPALSATTACMSGVMPYSSTGSGAARAGGLVSVNQSMQDGPRELNGAKRVR